MNITRAVKNIIETNKAIDNIISLAANNMLYKSILNKKIREYNYKIKDIKKYNIIIETTNICNARCIMCPNMIMKRKREVMSDKIFELIIERLKGEIINPHVFIMNGCGEPLADKNFIFRISRIKKEFPSSAVKFYSNLGLADKDTIEQIVSSGINEINISLNGLNRNNYEKTMGISYNNTMDNLWSLIEERNRKNKQLIIRISMALVSYNDKDVIRFIKTWEKKVNSVSINRVHTYAGAVNDPSGKFRLNFDKPTYPCKALFNTIVIGVAGDIFLCCLDYEGKYNFGNITKDSILKIFYSNRFDTIRKLHLEGKQRDVTICSKCSSIYRNGFDWFFENHY